MIIQSVDVLVRFHGLPFAVDFADNGRPFSAWIQFSIREPHFFTPEFHRCPDGIDFNGISAGVLHLPVEPTDKGRTRYTQQAFR